METCECNTRDVEAVVKVIVPSVLPLWSCYCNSSFLLVLLQNAVFLCWLISMTRIRREAGRSEVQSERVLRSSVVERPSAAAPRLPRDEHGSRRFAHTHAHSESSAYYSRSSPALCWPFTGGETNLLQLSERFFHFVFVHLCYLLFVKWGNNTLCILENKQQIWKWIVYLLCSPVASGFMFASEAMSGVQSLTRRRSGRFPIERERAVRPTHKPPTQSTRCCNTLLPEVAGRSIWLSCLHINYDLALGVNWLSLA